MDANTYIEQGARFQCVPDCGFCCGFWDIHIDAKRKDALLERAWVETVAQDLTKRERAAPVQNHWANRTSGASTAAWYLQLH